ncbi:unnamed protein product [Nesidiocoris tenuis]|uniref:TP53-regulated inhibitor of apoptosis 1 n=1 Tax=Nesidiocoris tenuis TaxID=355587 RepID=A0A6H5GBK5_9HEMI|nr:unnamed protein product [Nesidiocoris tenuis]
MNSIGKSCNEIKKQYDDCFQVWFSEKFLNGETDESCSSLYKMYQHCLQKSMKDNHIELKDVDLQVLGTDKEARAPDKK